MIRVVLDANVVISGTIFSQGASGHILRAWRTGRFAAVTCSELILEVDEKLRLPRIGKKYRITDLQIANVVSGLKEAATSVPARATVDPIPPDPKDIMLFSAALESDADFIVTGDKALLDFSWTGRAQIISPRQFYEQYVREGEPSS